jgi:hypothetical protein
VKLFRASGADPRPAADPLQGSTIEHSLPKEAPAPAEQAEAPKVETAPAVPEAPQQQSGAPAEAPQIPAPQGGDVAGK